MGSDAAAAEKREVEAPAETDNWNDQHVAWTLEVRRANRCVFQVDFTNQYFRRRFRQEP